MREIWLKKKGMETFFKKFFFKGFRVINFNFVDFFKRNNIFFKISSYHPFIFNPSKFSFVIPLLCHFSNIFRLFACLCGLRHSFAFDFTLFFDSENKICQTNRFLFFIQYRKDICKAFFCEKVVKNIPSKTWCLKFLGINRDDWKNSWRSIWLI